MLTCNDCIHCEVCVRQKIYGEYSITECKGHFLGKEDVVEIVHCKDCKDYVAEFCTRDIKGRTNMFYMQPTDFCSYGEKRSDNNDE